MSNFRFSALALAGLAAGITSASAFAGTKDKKSCKAKASCKGVTVDSAKVQEDRSCSGTGHCGGVTVDSVMPRVKVLSAKTEAEFEAACTAAGKQAVKTSCAGKNSCKGIYFVGGKTSEVACKGKSSCHGLVCAL